MKDSLAQKIRDVELDHADGVVADSFTQHNQARRDAANRYIGGAMAIDRLKEHLASQVIIALMTVEEENLYLEFGCQTFAEFLDRKEFSEMSKSSFYRLRELFIKEGPAKYDLLTDWGVPAKLRKQLESGDIEIDGNEIVIGGEERISLSESPKLIKSVIEQLVKDKIGVTEDLARAENKLEKQQLQLRQGQDEFDQLQRTLDALKSGNPYERGLSRTLYELLELTRLIGQLPDDQKAGRGRDAMPLVWAAIKQVKASYGSTFTFEDSPTTHSSDLDEIAAQVLSGDDDEA